MQLQTLKTKGQNPSDARINQLEIELLAFSSEEGKQQGTVNKPTTVIEFKAVALNTIQTRVQVEINETQKEYQPVSGMVVSNEIQKTAKDKIIPIQSEIKDLEHEHKVCENIKKQCCQDLSMKWKRIIVYFFAGGIAISEGCLSFDAFRIAGMSKMPSYATAIGVALAIGLGTHFMAQYIKYSKNKMQLLLRYSLVLIPAFTGFWFLGHIRSDGYSVARMLNISIGEHQISQPGISGLTLTVISFLLFLAGLMFSIRFAKTKEEAGLKKQYDIANQEGKKASKQIQKNLKTIDQIQSDCNIKTEEALRRYEYAVATEQKLMSIGKKAVGLFITTNLRYRTDHITPEFFANQPKLEYTTFFDNLKKNEQ